MNLALNGWTRNELKQESASANEPKIAQPVLLRLLQVTPACGTFHVSASPFLMLVCHHFRFLPISVSIIHLQGSTVLGRVILCMWALLFKQTSWKHFGIVWVQCTVGLFVFQFIFGDCSGECPFAVILSLSRVQRPALSTFLCLA